MPICWTGIGRDGDCVARLMGYVLQLQPHHVVSHGQRYVLRKRFFNVDFFEKQVHLSGSKLLDCCLKLRLPRHRALVGWPALLLWRRDDRWGLQCGDSRVERLAKVFISTLVYRARVEPCPPAHLSDGHAPFNSREIAILDLNQAFKFCQRST